MNIRVIVFGLLSALLLSGCVQSLNPFYGVTATVTA